LADWNIVDTNRILRALLLVQMEGVEEERRLPLLVQAGWSDGEIASVLGISEDLVAVRRSRFGQEVKAEK
jgi:DNA-directed RNA polymerase specialized sigma24 family protein